MMLKSKKSSTFYIFLTGTVITMAIIFAFSCQTSDESTIVSDSFYDAFVGNAVQEESDETSEDIAVSLQPIIAGLTIRKLAHIFLFSVLGMFMFMLSFSYKEFQGQLKSTIFAIVLSFAYACADEFHQLFIEGRTARIHDVMLDMIGAIAGVLIVVTVATIYRTIKHLCIRTDM